MRKYLIVILFILLTIGMAGAVTLTTTPTVNFGPAAGFKNPGTIQGGDLYATDDILVGDDAEVDGDLAVTGAISAGAGTISSGVYDGNLRLAAGHYLYSTTGAGGIDFSNATGIFTGPSGIAKLLGAASIYGTTYLNGTSLASGAALTMAGAGKFTSGTGVTKILGVESVYGNLLTNGTTVATGSTLAVTDADKLTVGSKIIPQYVTVTFPLTSASVNGTVFVPALNNYSLAGVAVCYNVSSTGSGAGTVKLMKCTSGQHPDTQGVEMLTAGISLKGTIGVPLTGTLAAASWKAKVNTTEFVGIRFNTAITSLNGGAMTMSFQRIA